MPNEYINFLEEEELFKKNNKRKGIARFIVTILSVVITITLVYSLNVLLINSSLASTSEGTVKKGTFFSNLFSSIKKISILSQLNSFIDEKKGKLNGEDEDRINILLLGIGGEGHEAGQLADTIILASLKPSTNQASMLSIPRDLSVPIKDYGWYKINSAHSFGEQKQEGEGINWTEDVVKNITGEPIHYYIRIDFDGFEKLIDDLGGVCLNVENDLIDYQYPIRGREDSYPLSSRFEYLNIKKGEQCMDGSLALKYARSRHALGVEGTDFARAKRQQNVLAAIKDKVVSMDTLLNPQKVIKVLDDLNKNIKTNLELTEIIRMAKLGKNIDQTKIIKKVLNNDPAGPLYDNYITTEDGQKAYILSTKTGDFSQIQGIAQNIFTEVVPQETKNLVTPSAPSVSVIEKIAKIEIQNGTTIPGWAYQTSLDLKELNLDIVKIGNAFEQNYTQTTVYAFDPDKFKDTVNLLKEKLNAKISYELPSWMKDEKENSSKADILIILGKKS